ncbi:hypothetical protein [Desulfotalea psychrophila]|nr:hypothetical protein [Desulfotalea psychrophila]
MAEKVKAFWQKHGTVTACFVNLAVIIGVICATFTSSPEIRRDILGSFSDLGTWMAGVGTIGLLVVALKTINDWKKKLRHDTLFQCIVKIKYAIRELKIHSKIMTDTGSPVFKFSYAQFYETQHSHFLAQKKHFISIKKNIVKLDIILQKEDQSIVELVSMAESMYSGISSLLLNTPKEMPDETLAFHMENFINSYPSLLAIIEESINSDLL